MTKRLEYLTRVHTALDRLQVKASLAKLQVSDADGELREKYDTVRERLRELAESSDERWHPIRERLDAAWHAFAQGVDDLIEKQRPAAG